MKLFVRMELSFFVLGFLSCHMALAQDLKTDKRQAEIAHKVVTVSAKVKPGEVVVISGGIQKLPLMEALAIEAAKAGARVGPLFITTDRLQRLTLTDVSEEYLGQQWAGVVEEHRRLDIHSRHRGFQGSHGRHSRFEAG